MCGISAIYSWSGGQILGQIHQMTSLIKHRGPDDEGYTFFSPQSHIICGGKDTPENVYYSSISYTPSKPISSNLDTSSYYLALGHRRLSILDLSESGHQPFSDPSQKIWITYNGEIYNFVELREELQTLGYSFKTHSDTEVLINAYLEWNLNFLDRLNGMFAFVIYDQRSKKLIAARDRSGVKPLYYWISPEGFIAIASEIKQFTNLPGWEATLNGQAAYDFLNWGITNHDVETHFKGVFQILAGEVLTTTLSLTKMPKFTIDRWYQLPIQQFKGSFQESAEQFAHLLGESVRLRTRADVAVGSCLSGGLDSSSIVCLVNKLLHDKQFTFSSCSHHKKFDEREFIEEVVKQTQVSSHYTYPDLQNLISELDTILWHQDEPFGSTSIYAQWEVFKLVKKHGVKVMLDGQGSDEQLGGYSGFYSARLADLLKSYRFISFWKELKESKMNYPFRLMLNQLLPDWIRQPLRRFAKKPATTSPWINTDLLKATLRDPHAMELPIKSLFQKQCYAQTTRTSLPMLLHFEDRDSMAHSVEARTPFLDYRLMEFIQSLPADHKLSRGETKKVLRHGLEDVLPQKIRERRCKLGFATPEEVWVRKSDPELFRRMLSEAIDSSQGILRERALKLGEEMIDGNGVYDSVLWRMIAFGKWMKRFDLSV